MTPEFHRPMAIGRIGPEGREERLAASAGECAALARRFGIPAVLRLDAMLRLRPEPDGGILVTGEMSAEVVQDCVVTLEPVTQSVAEPVALRFLPPGREPSDDPEGPDEVPVEGGTIDLGEAVAEQLSLALDPYPRAAGAVLPGEEGTSGEGRPGAFAALAALRKRS